MAQNRTVAAGAALGTTPPTSTISGDENALIVNFGSGTTPATGTAVTITLSTNYNSVLGDETFTPVVRALNEAARGLGLTAAWGASKNSVILNAGVAPTASQAAGTYSALLELVATP